MAVSRDPLVEALRATHGLHVHQIRSVPEGVTTTRNVTAVDPARGRVLVKVYSADTDLDAEEKALNEVAASDTCVAARANRRRVARNRDGARGAEAARDPGRRSPDLD